MTSLWRCISVSQQFSSRIFSNYTYTSRNFDIFFMTEKKNLKWIFISHNVLQNWLCVLYPLAKAWGYINTRIVSQNIVGNKISFPMYLLIWMHVYHLVKTDTKLVMFSTASTMMTGQENICFPSIWEYKLHNVKVTGQKSIVSVTMMTGQENICFPSIWEYKLHNVKVTGQKSIVSVTMMTGQENICFLSTWEYKLHNVKVTGQKSIP